MEAALAEKKDNKAFAKSSLHTITHKKSVKTLMKTHPYRIILVVAALIIVISAVYLDSQTSTIDSQNLYTELWILDANHNAGSYPSNITNNTQYSVFLGATNHLGTFANYQIQMKLCNAIQPETSPTLTLSETPSIYNLTMPLADNEAWELPVTLSFNYTYDSAQHKITLRNITFNGEIVNVENQQIYLEAKRNGYFENLFFELWTQNNNDTGFFEYTGRYVGLLLSFNP